MLPTVILWRKGALAATRAAQGKASLDPAVHPKASDFWNRVTQARAIGTAPNVGQAVDAVQEKASRDRAVQEKASRDRAVLRKALGFLNATPTPTTTTMRTTMGRIPTIACAAA